MKLINYPERIERSSYSRLIEKIVHIVSIDKNLLSIYQMGSIKNPGISDLDLICVFKDNSSNFDNIREQLSPLEKKILTHGLFAVYESDFLEACKNNFISNLNHIYGKKISFPSEIAIPELFKTQIALEYLLKLHITLETQSKLGIVKVRSFLLLAKAAIFDLELLNISSGSFYDSVQKVINLRDCWFELPDKDKTIVELINEFNKNLNEFLNDVLIFNKLYLSKTHFQLPGKINLFQSRDFRNEFRGIRLPSFLDFFGNYYIKIQYRLISKSFYVPFDLIDNEELKQKQQFGEKLHTINKVSFPFFLALNSSLTIY
jgi:hypothetical protein